MKRTLLLGLMLLGGITAQAQLQAPDFTVTDINGTEHVLADYLAEGKTVLVDVSATWCGPCWQFHNMHTLANIHEAYGPGGSNEVVVLFIEGDSSTPTNNLYGENGPGTPNGYPTQGDWVTGTPYPIIEDAALAIDLDINNADGLAFPSLYRICPDGTYSQIPNTQFGDIQNIINSMDNCTPLEGATNHAKVASQNVRVCEDNASVETTASFTNYGTNAITTATFNVKNSEGEVVSTQTYSGNLAMFGSATVTFDNASYASGEYTVEIADVNGADPYTEADTNFDIELAAETSINVVVNVHTDNYPGEISWAIKDGNGEVAASGGPYQEGTDDQWGGGGPDANTIKSHYVVLPESIDCYTIEMYDNFGDGWIYGSTDHGVEILTHDGETSIFMIETGSLDFGDELVTPSAFRTNGTLNNEVFETGKFAVYPNPTSGVLNFTTQEPVNVTVLDLTGKVVFTAKDINNGQSVNLSSLQSGMYIAKINGQNAERIEKIVIK